MIGSRRKAAAADSDAQRFARSLDPLGRELSDGKRTILHSERGGAMTAGSIANWFAVAYRKLGLDGCSSHSGRRTFITRAA